MIPEEGEFAIELNASITLPGENSKTSSVGCMRTSTPTLPTQSGYVNESYCARPNLKLTS